MGHRLEQSDLKTGETADYLFKIPLLPEICHWDDPKSLVPFQQPLLSILRMHGKEGQNLIFPKQSNFPDSRATSNWGPRSDSLPFD